jgi:hypothetical protein
MNKLLYLSLITALGWSCKYSETEKYQSKRDNVVNVRDKVKEIEMEEVLIGSVVRLFLMGDYLIIADHKSYDKLIHLFDKNNFSHVTSVAHFGQGPGEITILGYIGSDEVNRRFYVSDHGKQRIFTYPLDSVLANPSYMPEVKMKMNEGLFPDKYQYINDTLSIGLIIERLGYGAFNQSVAKWNMNTGEIRPMPYEHPNMDQKRISCAASLEDSIYVECYSLHNLMTICSLNGDLKYNIYGGMNWNSRSRTNSIHHYDGVAFCNGRIIASYSGGDYNSDEYFPTKFLVFDITGNYLQTIETGYRIQDFCCDEANNRIIMAFDDNIQFGYLELDEIIE